MRAAEMTQIQTILGMRSAITAVSLLTVLQGWIMICSTCLP